MVPRSLSAYLRIHCDSVLTWSPHHHPVQYTLAVLTDIQDQRSSRSQSFLSGPLGAEALYTGPSSFSLRHLQVVNQYLKQIFDCRNHGLDSNTIQEGAWIARSSFVFFPSLFPLLNRATPPAYPLPTLSLSPFLNSLHCLPFSGPWGAEVYNLLNRFSLVLGPFWVLRFLIDSISFPGAFQVPGYSINSICYTLFFLGSFRCELLNQLNRIIGILPYSSSGSNLRLYPLRSVLHLLSILCSSIFAQYRFFSFLLPLPLPLEFTTITSLVSIFPFWNILFHIVTSPGKQTHSFMWQRRWGKKKYSSLNTIATITYWPILVFIICCQLGTRESTRLCF